MAAALRLAALLQQPISCYNSTPPTRTRTCRRSQHQPSNTRTPQPTTMWYAHNYAHRRSHSRPLGRIHRFSHDYTHETPEYGGGATTPVNRVYLDPPEHVFNPSGRVYGHVHDPPEHEGQRCTRSNSSAPYHLYRPSGEHLPHERPHYVTDCDHNHAFTYSQPHNDSDYAGIHSARSQLTQENVYAHDQALGGYTSAGGRGTSAAGRMEQSRYGAEFTYYQESEVDSEEYPLSTSDVRVELPYTRRQPPIAGPRRYNPRGHYRQESNHVIRRWHDPSDGGCDDDSSVVGMSYQQQATAEVTGSLRGTTVPLGISALTLHDDREGLLLEDGLVREWVRAVGVLAASGTLVTLVVLGFGVYNMLITTLFLLFVLTTVALLIFLLMRRPPCCPCCRDPFEQGLGLTSQGLHHGSQAAQITYLAETHGIVVKKRIWDSPPPYESPPDYQSLSPELIMSAKSLTDINASSNVHNSTHITTAPVSVHSLHPPSSPPPPPPPPPPPTAPCCNGRESPVCSTPLIEHHYESIELSQLPAAPDDKVKSSPEEKKNTCTMSSPSSVPSTVVDHSATVQPPPSYESLQLTGKRHKNRKNISYQDS